jgi:Ca2+-binding EF-hand superfamily protein
MPITGPISKEPLDQTQPKSAAAGADKKEARSPKGDPSPQGKSKANAPRKSMLGIPPAEVDQKIRKSMLMGPSLIPRGSQLSDDIGENGKVDENEIAEEVTRFARWAVSYWDTLKNMFVPRNAFDGRKRASFAPGADSNQPSRRESMASSTGSNGPRYGSRRASSVAGAGGPANGPRNPERAFMEGLRGDGDGNAPGGARRASRTRSAPRASISRRQDTRPITSREFVLMLKQHGFIGDCMTIFNEIEKENSEIKKSLTHDRNPTIVYSQLMSFERRPTIIMASLAEFCSLKRGTTMRAWRLDMDLKGSGKCEKADFMRFGKSVGCEEQCKFLWDNFRPASEQSLTFADLDPVEYNNAEAFAELLLEQSDWNAEVAWENLDDQKRGCLTFEQFRNRAKQFGFEGSVRPIFEGLTVSNQGRLWREEFEYLWVIAIGALKHKRHTAHGKPIIEGFEDGGPPPEEHMEMWQSYAWEPSEYEANARDFARWASMNWTGLFELFVYQETRSQVSAGELERWLQMLGFMGDVAAVFLEIGRERCPGGLYEPSVVTMEQLGFFRNRRNSIVLKEFNAHLIRRRGSSLRAWKLDLDSNGSGLIDKSEFMKAARRLGYGDDILVVWDAASREKRDRNSPVCFEDVNPEEAANLHDFASKLIERAGWNLTDSWDLIDDGGDGVITVKEFQIICDDLEYEGNAELLFTGISSSSQGFIWKEDFDYFWTIGLLQFRHKWKQPPIFAMSVTAQTIMGGPYTLLGRLGVDSRGLTADGKVLGMREVTDSLAKMGYHGNALRAAVELVVKVLVGHSADPYLSAKGWFLKKLPTSASAKGEDKPAWLGSSPVSTEEKTRCRAFSKVVTNRVWDGNVQEERRRRIGEWHTKVGTHLRSHMQEDLEI